jgi:hypothetical protein
MTSKQLAVNQIVKLAFNSENGNKHAKILRRVLRKQILESLSSKTSDEDIPNDLSQIAGQLQIKMNEDQAFVQELVEIADLLEQADKDSDYRAIFSLGGATFAVGSAAIVGGLLGGVPGAIVAATATPLFVKIIQNLNQEFRNKHS